MQPLPTHVLIAANPKSGAVSGSAKVSALANRLRESSLTVEICDCLDRLRERSQFLFQAGQLRAVVSAGGDGTAAAVVNRVPIGTPVAVLSLGTENLLAKFLKLNGEIDQVAQAILAGQIVRLDAGSADGRLFLIMLGVGFDADVVARMHAARRGHIRRWSYSKPIWQAIRNYQYPSISVEYWPERPAFQAAGSVDQVDVDQADVTHGTFTHEAGKPSGEQFVRRFDAAWLFAFNLPRYAANLAFCPQAIGDDGQLDLCGFRQGGTLRSLVYLAWLALGRHQHLRDFTHVRANRFRLSSTMDVPYQVDGDPGGKLPLEVEVLPKRLTLLLPPKQP